MPDGEGCLPGKRLPTGVSFGGRQLFAGIVDQSLRLLRGDIRMGEPGRQILPADQHPVREAAF